MNAKPGNLPSCRSCKWQWPDPSHPSPCTVLHWEGARHVAPSIIVTDAVVVCEDFRPAEDTNLTGA